VLMRAHAGQGNQGMVEAAYQRCVEALKGELSLEPSSETRQLYEQLIRRELMSRVGSVRSFLVDHPGQEPAFLSSEEPHPVERPIFVARERELAKLGVFLDSALSGKGHIIFVTGEAGSGKSALVREFAHRAQEAHANLTVASGNCNANTGIGDPYLPFREILALLTGDVQARWAAGAISRDHALRLWNTLPLTVQALLDAGPDLIDTFIPGKALVERAAGYASGKVNWLTRLDELVGRKTNYPMGSSPQQSDISDQFTKVLQSLALQAPLVLVFDDLQWADLGSISLLFHLGRRLTTNRILIVGVYRPEEVALGRDGARHPLEQVVNELQREFGDMIVNVDQAKAREFVEALLDSELNSLGAPFQEMLFRQTHGHPLFTIELLRGMQERGDLVRIQDEEWVEGAALDWERLPARVEAVVAERISRLAQPLRATLRVASVEGEMFTAEVVARVLGIDERQTVQRLSRELDSKHRLVSAQAIDRIGSQRVSRYRFQHHLFQKYLYDSMDEVERAYLHEDVGNALEEIYANHTREIASIAPQLAHQFMKAGITDKAIRYLLQAGEEAVRLSAYQEAIPHLARGRDLLISLSNSPERAQQELAFQLTLGLAWQGARGTQSTEMREAYIRARELCQQIGETSQLCQVLGELSLYHYVRAEHKIARELGEEALVQAQHDEDPLLIVMGHWYLGIVLFSLGEYLLALTHLKQVISSYDPQRDHQLFVFLRGSDVGVSAIAYAACCLWCLGYPDQALQHSQQALTLARELDHPFSLADVLCYGGCLFNAMRRDAPALKKYADELERLSQEKVEPWSGEGIRYRGEALVMMGQIQEGIRQMRQGMATVQSKGERCYMAGTLRTLAKALAEMGHPEQGMTTLAEAFNLVEETDERHWDAELHQVQAELLLMQENEAEAEASFQIAIQVARRQSAKSWELRAATGLARLWRSQGKTGQARQVLTEIYDWFTEGFDTPDLIEAKALLEELA